MFTPRTQELPNHEFLVRFTIRGMRFLCGARLKSNWKKLVSLKHSYYNCTHGCILPGWSFLLEGLQPDETIGDLSSPAACIVVPLSTTKQSGLAWILHVLWQNVSVCQSVCLCMCLRVSIILKGLLLPEAISYQINSVPGVEYLAQNVGQGCPEDPEDNTGIAMV